MQVSDRRHVRSHKSQEQTLIYSRSCFLTHQHFLPLLPWESGVVPGVPSTLFSNFVVLRKWIIWFVRYQNPHYTARIMIEQEQVSEGTS
jgi:hypothetical protein